MKQGRLVLPQPVGKLLSLLPAYPGSLIFVTGLNLAIAKHLPSDVQESLNGKKMRIKVVDAQVAFHFQWRERAFVACRGDGEADLTIAASAHDFLLLAQRQEDPDTLFFSRRLAMEGDTELGLMVKNMLDAIDLPVFDLRSLTPGRVFAWCRQVPRARTE